MNVYVYTDSLNAFMVYGLCTKKVLYFAHSQTHYLSAKHQLSDSDISCLKAYFSLFLF